MAEHAPRSHRVAARLRSLVTERLGLKLVSILVALLLWLVVRSREQAEGYLDLPVRTNLDSSVAPLADAPRVRVFVAGRGADLAKLFVSPPEVRGTVHRAPRDSVELELTLADVHLPADVGDLVHVVDVQPRRVTLRLATPAASAR